MSYCSFEAKRVNWKIDLAENDDAGVGDDGSDNGGTDGVDGGGIGGGGIMS